MRLSRTVAALALCALAVAPLGVAHAAPAAPIASDNIMFDGYCDGLHINLPSVGLPNITRTLDGHQTGCHQQGIFGQARANVIGQYGVKVSTEFVTIPLYRDFLVVNPDRTWVLYGYDRGEITIVNSGTWSLGVPAPRPGAMPSIFRDAAPTASPGSITGTKDITFDGQCDGMQLVSPSAGLGTRGTVDGHFTGCKSHAVIGARTKIGTSVKQAYVVQYEDARSWFQMTVCRNHTWVLFTITGNAITLVKRGTWSAGPPTPRAGPSVSD